MSFRTPILSLFFPPLCAGCDEVLADNEDHICRKCQRALMLTDEAGHRGNALERVFASQDFYHPETPIGKRLVRAAAYAFYPQHNPIRTIIHTMKFVKDPKLAFYLGKQAALSMAKEDFFCDIDLIIPIPLHPSRERERGFNQSEYLAQGIASVTGIALDTTHLFRSVRTEQQSLKSIAERQQMQQPFTLLHQDELAGKHLLLVDDVITSGTTMFHALTLLRAIPNCRYSIFTLAFARQL